MEEEGVKVKLGSMSDANFPKDAEGRVYHVGVKRGEVANRLITVGDHKRAATLANLFDSPAATVFLQSKRGFTVYTGTKNNVPITVVGTGMGIPMMDFVVRECRAIVDGPMAMLRLGTCGTINPVVSVGSVVVASQGSIMISRNPDAFHHPEKVHTQQGACGSEGYYRFSLPVDADPDLSAALVKHLKVTVPLGEIIEGRNATAETFYSSQGRIDPNFDDHNATLLDDLASKHPEVVSLEMETFHLLDLARSCCAPGIKASAAAIVLAQRRSNSFLDNESIQRLEREAGLACLLALVELDLGEKLMSGEECVWNSLVKH